MRGESKAVHRGRRGQGSSNGRRCISDHGCPPATASTAAAAKFE
jgi:hypothetical protein